MKDHFKEAHELPAFNFYKAEEDLTYMLKGNRNVMLTDAEKMELLSVLITLKEWFAVQYNKAAYNNNMSKVQKKYLIENKLIGYNGILVTLQPFNDILLSKVLSENTLNSLKNTCKVIGLPFIDYVDDFKKSVERYIKGANNDLNRINGEFVEKGTEFNYIREFLKVIKIVGVQADSMKITLIEWVELLKLANEQSS